MRLYRPAIVLASAAVLSTPPASAQELVYLLGAEATNNDDFGRSVADAGDLDGDGFGDLIVGAPFDSFNGASSGSVFCYSGRTGALIWTRAGEGPDHAFGWSVDGVGDLNGDGKSEVIVGAPLWDGSTVNAGKVYVLNGATGQTYRSVAASGSNAQLGTVVRALGDLDGDGVGDYACGSPYLDANALVDSGMLTVYSGAGGQVLFNAVGTYVGAKLGYSVDVVRATGAPSTSRILIGEPGYDGTGVDRGRAQLRNGSGALLATFNGVTDHEWAGATVAGVGDVTGDGIEDFAIASPYKDIAGVGADCGHVNVYSGATNGWIFGVVGPTASANLGVSLSRLGDVNGDGRDDFLAGAPGSDLGAVDAGQARIVSGANGSTLAWWYGGLNDHMGISVSTAGDLNHDGLPDIVYGAHEAPFGAGEAYVRMTGVGAPSIYCTAKVNSQGCTPQIAIAGVPSLSIAGDVWISAANVLNQKSGILFWGFDRNSAPFEGGVLCVQSPTRRTPLQSSGGTVGVDDCTGAYAFHFSHAYMGALALAAGDRVCAQYWSRDPADAHHSGLTDAAEFHVVP